MDHGSGGSRFRGPAAEGERSLGELVRELSDDAARLVRQELALARAEVRHNVRAAVRDAATVAVGAALAAVGALVLVAALVTGVGALLGRRYVLAALLVGLIFLAVGSMLAWGAVRDIRRRRMAPTETLATLRETGEWARAEVDGLRSVLAGAPDAATPGPPRVPYLRLHRPEEDAPPRVSEVEDAAPQPARTRPASREDDAPAADARLWRRVWHRFGADDVANQAAKVAYYFFLSLPPALMALFALAGLFGGAGTAGWLTTRLQAALPGEAGALVDDFVTEVARTEHPGLLSFGVLATLWAASNVMMALEDSLDVAFDARAKRSFLRRRAVALGTLLAVGVLFLAASAALLAGPALSRAAGLGPVGDAVWSVAQWPLAFACITGAFWLLYYLLPNRDQRPFRRTLLRSSALAAALWLVATLGFRVYISNFGSYGATYGLLGTVMVLLLWMYLTSMMILLGGEISSQMERRG